MCMKKIISILLICFTFVFALFVSKKYTCLHKITTPEHLITSEHTEYLSYKNRNLCELVAQTMALPLEDVLGLGYLVDNNEGGNTPILIKDGKPTNISEFNRMLTIAKAGQYRICNKKSGKYHLLSCKYGAYSKNYEILPLSEIKNYSPCSYCCKNTCKTSSKTKSVKKIRKDLPQPAMLFSNQFIKIFLSDHTTRLKPNNSCSSLMCKGLLNEINSASSTIDMAIYGYEKIPVIDAALKNAIKRGVKIRIVYDVDAKGNNYYSGTHSLANVFPDSVSDIGVTGLMHNKFFIFDSKKVITGSANLSASDMSGFNSNSVILINSPSAAQIYEYEFNQMFSSKFHKLKEQVPLHRDLILGDSKLKIYFSPKDNTVNKALIPLINSAQKYIYMPSFLITERDLTEALINAKKRGVDVKIVIDALYGRAKSTKHHILRENGIQVKTENYAGKLHSKSMIIDDRYLVIGSMNFSYSGNYVNDENLIVLENRNAAIFYRHFFEYLWSRIYDFWLTHDVAPESKYSIGSLEDGVDNDYDGLVDEKD